MDEFGSILATRSIGVLFQPIVSLDSGEVIGLEALARPPAGSSYAGPGELFAEAYRRGQVGEFDWVCRGATFKALLEHPVPEDLYIFINVEPAAMDAPCPVDIIGSYAAATNHYHFVVEVTERSLADDPGELMAAVGRIRDVPAGVAIDDVGAEPASLALMPLVAPDVIKLDLRLIQARPTPDVAAIVNAVMAESERTGALILAEGVETEAHVKVARAMGATLGQGWLFGHPKPLPMDLAPPSHTLAMTTPPVIAGETPFDVASAHRPRHLSTRELLAATSRHLELEVLRSSSRPVVLSGFESVENFDQATRRRYERLAPATALIAAFGVNMPAQPAPGVRGAPLSPDDPLSREWAVAVLDSYFSAALTARPTRPRDRSQWEVVITHNRGLVLAVARQMLQRLPGIHR